MTNDVGLSPLQEASDPLSDDQVVSRLRVLCRSSKKTEVEIIRLLVILQARHLDLEWTYSSLYEFCAERLGMTGGEATRRVAAARLIRKVPALLEYLSAGKLSMTTLLCLRDYVTAENADELLASVSNKSRREVQLVLAERRPSAGHRPRRPRSAREEVRAGASTLAPRHEGAGSYRLDVERSSGLHVKIELARKLMAERGSVDDLGTVVERAMDALLTELRASDQPSPTLPQQDERVGPPDSVEVVLSKSAGAPAQARQAARRRPSAKASRKSSRKKVGGSRVQPTGVNRVAESGSRSVSGPSAISEALHRPLKHRPTRRPSGARASAESRRTSGARG